MDASPAHNPHLRLISEHPLRMQAWRREQEAREAIVRENRAASRPIHPSGVAALDPHDPRWVLAARAYSQLQGTTMTPDRRERVLRTAKQLGVRVFDASLIIAIVQDHARRGKSIGEAQPMLNLIAPPEGGIGRRRSAWTRWLGAILLALLANAILIWWLMSA